MSATALRNGPIQAMVYFSEGDSDTSSEEEVSYWDGPQWRVPPRSRADIGRDEDENVAGNIKHPPIPPPLPVTAPRPNARPSGSQSMDEDEGLRPFRLTNPSATPVPQRVDWRV